jgi:hypothetical protein
VLRTLLPTSRMFLFLPVQIPVASGHLGGFSFHNIGLVECFSAFMSITSNTVGADGISVFSYLLSWAACFQSCNHLLCFSFYVEGGYYSADC